MASGHETVICRDYPFGSETYREAVRLRYEALRVPLGLEWRPQDFEAEASSLHLGAFQGGRLVATLILRPRDSGVVQMRQVAVAAAERGRGVGARLVRYAEALAAERGFTTLMAHARMAVIGFYLKLGYKREGEPFVEVGIPHSTVIKALGPVRKG